MADKNENVEKGEYVIGVAIILAALLLSATVWFSADAIQKAIGAVKLNVTAAAAQQQAAAAQQQAAAAQQQAAAAQQQAAAAQPTGDWSFESTDPGIGPKDAKVTLTVFADFQCPFCGITAGSSLGGTQYDAIRGSASKMEDYAKAGKIRFVYHTMAFLGQESIDSANAAFCAREIGGDDGFFKMHDLLFASQNGENKGTFSKDNLKKLAAQAGLNTTAMQNCIDSGKYDSQVTQSNTVANAVGVQGTPTFAINNEIAPSPEYAALKAQVDALLAK